MARYYIAWHNTSHGIGFLKNILAAFAKHHKILPQNSNEEKILLNAVGQSEMERYFDENPDVKPVFDKVVYFYTDQKVINETTSFSFSTRTGFTDDPELSVELRDAWLEIRRWYYEDKYKNNPFSDNKGLLAEVRKKLIEISANNSEKIPEEFNQKLWRFIHYFPIEDQIEWLKSESNLPQKIKNALLFVNMSRYGVRSLR
ncbi:MAG: hypothetical protein RMM53_13690, partial [Bacteroidia bacterium]|nr:hypothetical protein [Bacteroidia bacterium]